MRHGVDGNKVGKYRFTTTYMEAARHGLAEVVKERLNWEGSHNNLEDISSWNACGRGSRIGQMEVVTYDLEREAVDQNILI